MLRIISEASAEKSVPINQTEWDEFVAAQRGHLLQSWAWGELKRHFGWTPVRIRAAGAGAQVLFRQLPLGLTIGYVPKGPLVDWADEAQGRAILAALHAEARRRRAIFLKVEPDLWAVHGDRPNLQVANDCLQQAGFNRADSIQPRSSILVDIRGDETAMLAAMKQKTRYNIRLAQKKGVAVRRGEAGDVATFHRLATVTADRNEFGVHELGYYQTAYDLFAPKQCALLMAEFEGEPIAGLMVFRRGEKAYYFYGASSNQHRNLMATYLIQWEAIRWAKGQGCTSYDLWGIPEADPATLEAEFQQRQDGLWGVYRFKRGFGGQVIQTIWAYDYGYNRLLYRLYSLHRRF